MFFFGGKIMENSMQADGTMSIKPENVFIALFAIMFGASHAGTATAFGPDMGKAQAAAERIFKIKEAPSQINAIEIDKDSSKIRLNLDEIKGKIEFREVWFRYPTRKEDFVLRGLNITINPSEQVALVGESGCGKSTFVNLMMRFYDVDSGTIFLDDIDIRKINLHDLRKAVSLVMQEPIIFNYTILENILYGKTEAFNTEVLKAAELANAMEFIEKNDTFTFDESATSLKNEMIKNKIALVSMIGVEKYDEELAILGKMEEQEKKRGEFHTQYGDVDKRENDKKDA
jgi:ATP-binding cassette subfamily B (MDR/TAP) protein 1